MFGALTLLAFYLGQTMTGELAAGQTMAFIVLSLSQVVQAFNMRWSIRCLRLGRFSNKKLNLAALASLLLVLAGCIYAADDSVRTCDAHAAALSDCVWALPCTARSDGVVKKHLD